ncbi:MAG: histidine phosphatase family protein [Bifidobacteriaceae bacterium]|jgi:broad specificity phosphatase PhoE|nr:histidine phosphatase family protein [Bifidobacteriaceae bacterium]
MVTTTVHLVRHGEVANPTGVLYGIAPGYHLSERGLDMAQTTADWLLARPEADIVHLASSPLIRAQETARPLVRALGLEPVLDPRLIEAGNIFAGQVVTIPFLLRPSNLRRLYNPFRPSWGEPYALIAHRMRAAIIAARNAARGHEAVVVTHQLPIWTARMDAEHHRFWHDPRRRQCALGSVTSLVFDGDRVAAVAYADPCQGL